MNSGFTSEIRDTALIIRFNRPEIRNPLSIAVLKGLLAILDEVENSKSIKRVIFTGSDNVFASGADLREIAGVTGRKARKFALRGQDLMNRICSVRQNTIAAVNGICYGGALDLALACDRRVASHDASFCHPGTGLGIITGWGGTQRLPRLIGKGRALEMFFTATPIDAVEALRIGLIEEISANPLETAFRTAGFFTSQSPISPLHPVL